MDTIPINKVSYFESAVEVLHTADCGLAFLVLVFEKLKDLIVHFVNKLERGSAHPNGPKIVGQACRNIIEILQGEKHSAVLVYVEGVVHKHLHFLKFGCDCLIQVA